MPKTPNDLAKTDPFQVTPADRARHCFELAERVNGTRKTHEKVYTALAFEDGELHDEMLVMSKEGNARRREVREELKILDKLDGRSLTLISAAQAMWLAEKDMLFVGAAETVWLAGVTSAHTPVAWASTDPGLLRSTCQCRLSMCSSFRTQ